MYFHRNFSDSCQCDFRCLLDLTMKDCVRENDGEMMVTLWRIHMPEFFTYNHYKYCILGHRLLSGIEVT